MSAPQLHPQERLELGEAELIQDLIGALEALILKPYVTGTTYRDTHAKGHAAVRATFTVAADLPAELRVGLFAQPGTYPAWVRLSNTNPTPQADIKRDMRALSIKLMEVDGARLWQGAPGDRTLDITMMGAQTFLASSLRAFYDLEVALLAGGFRVPRFFLTHPGMARTILRSQRKAANLLQIPYWSETAFAFGDRIVQHHLRPHQKATSTVPRRPTPNFLRERLKADLARQPASFDFMVQFQTDPAKMPVENSMVAWDPRRSPYRNVATLTLLAQEFDSPAQMQFCENLSFNPWRTLPEHRPLGSINRARLLVYPAIARFRHGRNNVSVWREPTPDDPVFGPTR